MRAAYSFARAAHAGQRLKTDGTPYILHPLAVGALLHEAGFGEEVVAAGLLHDTVEDTEARLDDLTARFGNTVSRIVASLTEPAAIDSYERRKAAHRRQIAQGGVEAAAVFAADKLVSARNLRGALAARGEASVDGDLDIALERKLDHYRASLADLERSAPSLAFLPALRSELDQLELQRRSEAQRGGYPSRPAPASTWRIR